MGDHSVRHAALANERSQRAGVETGKPNDAAAFQPGIEMARGPVVRRRRDRRVQHHAARARRRREVDGLDVFLVGADIADVRKGEGDDLPGIGRVGQDFLVAGHRGVETDLADGLPGRAKTDAFEHGAIGQHQERRRLGLVPAGQGPRRLRLCRHRQGPKSLRRARKPQPAPLREALAVLRDDINSALKEAMKAGQARRVSTLRLINAAVLQRETSGAERSSLSDPEFSTSWAK